MSMVKMDGIQHESGLVFDTEESIKTVNKLKLTDFRYKRLLSDNKETKTVAVEGYFAGNPQPAVLILEKESFQEEDLRDIVLEKVTETFHNDIYYGGVYHPKEELTGVKVTLIYPATEKHIDKYENQFIHIIEESPELYNTVTLPFLKKEQFSLQWVFNILEHKSEGDRIVFEDPDPEVGFILCSDLKWDGKSVTSLYLLALPFKKGIMSLRDLTQDHLPLLKNILHKGVKAIKEKYSIPGSQLRIYVHYQPSFYHFHVHFTNLQYCPPSINTERAHLLSTVINNLEIMSNYYQISKLDFSVREGENLFAQYESIGLVKSVSKK